MKMLAELPSVPTLLSLPGFDAPTFDTAAAQAIEAMLPKPGPRHRSIAEIAIVLGDVASPVPPELTTRVAIDGRRVRLRWGDAGRMPWQPANALVALAAAGMTAMEIHKAALRRLPARSGTTAALLARSYIDYELPLDLPSQLSLGRLDVVSAGAISQNALWSLSVVDGLRVDLRIFDRDATELSNVNRCPLIYLDRLGQLKVDIVRDMVPSSWTVDAVARHFTAEDAQTLQLAPITLVGADDIVVRHTVQAGWPAFLVVGATSHFEIVVSEHVPDAPCAGCVHPRATAAPAIIPTVSFVSFWAGYLSAVRILGHAIGAPFDLDRQLTIGFPLQLQGSSTGQLSFRADCPVGHGADIRPWLGA